MSGAIYSSRDDGTIHVENEAGQTGVFQRDGRWLRGELKFADPHMLPFVEGPSRASHRARSVSGNAGASERSGVPVPDLFTNTQTTGSRGMELGLNGKRALVTAATRGIGLAIAQAFADQGCSVAICARGDAGLEAACKDLEARGAKIFAKSVDVADGDALRGFIAEAASDLGGLDVYVSN